MRVFLVNMVLALIAAIGVGPAWADEPIVASDCEMCHDELVPEFIAGAHGQAMANQSERVVQWSCVECHGAAEAHLEDPSTETISGTPGAEACLSCHPDSAAKIELMNPAHNRFGVVCLDCHDSGHGDTDANHLLRDEPRKLCAECHRGEAAAFRLPFAHRDGTEPFQCDACHSVHGDTRVGRLRLLAGGGACIDCHTDKARPFVFPHPPVDRPGCGACHTPHGSTNPRMLTRYRIELLCLECHSDVPAFHDVTQPRYRICQNCHAAVHGSNRDPRLIEE